jgi:phosphatidylinositol 4-kinase type 2
MFARQIAVMKGQAWNVVETLKDKGHGPLELTRRTRVCVWDDLQEIPIVVPLRQSSDEMRLQQEREALKHLQEREELDIGAARGAAPDLARSLLKLSPPPGELIEPSMFNTSREDTGLPDGDEANSGDVGKAAKVTIRTPPAGTTSLGRRPQNKVRMSYDEPRKPWMTDPRKRTLSFTTRPWTDDEEAEGDLGYAATEDMEGYTKKVIVERLETVKAKNPVFTWC